MFTIEELRKRRADRNTAAKAEAAPVEAAPPAEEAPDTAEPALPPGISPEAFAALPEATQAQILKQQGLKQTSPINPPEVEEGLAASAAKSAEVVAGKTPAEKPKRTRKAKEPPPPPPPPTVDFTPVIEALTGLKAELSVDSTPVLEALAVLTAAVNKQTEVLEFIAEGLEGR